MESTVRDTAVDEELILLASEVATVLASLHLKRLGLHASGGCFGLYIRDLDVPQMHRSFFIGGDEVPGPLEEQIDESSRHNVTRLVIHVIFRPSCPSLLGLGFSALKELFLADTWWESQYPRPAPFLVQGLEEVAGTLRHLTVSSSWEETCVELPPSLSLQTLVCVCNGTLLLHCDAHALGQSLGDVLLGYTTVVGTGVRLVEELAPRLETAVLEMHGVKSLMQSLSFTRAGLVGEW
jgi:hypothetical protein